MHPLNHKGFSPLLLIVIVVILAGVGFAGWYVWDKNQTKDHAQKASTSTLQDDQSKNQDTSKIVDEVSDWVVTITQARGFSMKVPDGWSITNYPGDFLGSFK